jgi:hypothetical protein
MLTCIANEGRISCKAPNLDYWLSFKKEPEWQAQTKGVGHQWWGMLIFKFLSKMEQT